MNLQEAMQSVEGRAVARVQIRNYMKGYPLYQSLSVLIGAAIDLVMEQGLGKEHAVQIFTRTVKEIVEKYE